MRRWIFWLWMIWWFHTVYGLSRREDTWITLSETPLIINSLIANTLIYVISIFIFLILFLVPWFLITLFFFSCKERCEIGDSGANQAGGDGGWRGVWIFFFSTWAVVMGESKLNFLKNLLILKIYDMERKDGGWDISMSYGIFDLVNSILPTFGEQIWTLALHYYTKYLYF